MNILNLKSRILVLSISILMLTGTSAYAGNEMKFASIDLNIQAAAELPKLPISPEVVTEINTQAPQDGLSLEEWSNGDSEDLHLSDDLIEANRDFLEFQDTIEATGSF